MYVGLPRHQVLQVLHLLPECSGGDVLRHLAALSLLELLLEGRPEVLLLRLMPGGDLGGHLLLRALIYEVGGGKTLLLGLKDGGRRLRDARIPQVVMVWPRHMVILLFELRMQLPVQGALCEQARENLLEGANTDSLDVLLVTVL